MTILDQQFTKLWLRSTVLCFFVFIVLFLTGDLFGLTEDFLASPPSISTFVTYLFYRTGFSLFFLSPLVGLISSYWTVVHWKRHNEWTATLSSGRSPWILLRGPILGILLMGLGLIVFNITLLPQVSTKMNKIRDYQFKGANPPEPVYNNLHLRLDENTSLRIGRFEPGSKQLSDLKITEQNGGRLNRSIVAEKARYNNGNEWTLSPVTIRTFQENGTVVFDTKPSYTIKLEDPDVLNTVFKNNPRVGSRPPEQLSLPTLKKMINFRRKHGLNHSWEAVYYHWTFAYPLSTVLLSIAGLVIGIRFDMKRTTGIGVCLFFGFVYWAGFNLLLAFGKSSTYLGGNLEFSLILASTYGAQFFTGILLLFIDRFRN